MAMGYDRRYLNKDFQYLPVKDFTKLFERMLDHLNITVCLNTDALEHLKMSKREITYEGKPVECLLYTGAEDVLFDRKYGPLPYRPLDIRYQLGHGFKVPYMATNQAVCMKAAPVSGFHRHGLGH